MNPYLKEKQLKDRARKELMESIKILLTLIALLFTLWIVIDFTLEQKKSCEDRGGALVQGIIGWSCVAGPAYK